MMLSYSIKMALVLGVFYAIYLLGKKFGWFGKSILPYSASTVIVALVSITCLYCLYTNTTSLMCMFVVSITIA